MIDRSTHKDLNSGWKIRRICKCHKIDLPCIRVNAKVWSSHVLGIDEIFTQILCKQTQSEMRSVILVRYVGKLGLESKLILPKG